MARFVRFIVHQKIDGESRRMGLFTAAYHLRNEEELLQHDRERLEELVTWFEGNLTAPPRSLLNNQAIFWYRDVGPFSQRMWELVYLLRDYRFTAEQITASFVGRVVYQDKHQLAAQPPKS